MFYAKHISFSRSNDWKSQVWMIIMIFGVNTKEIYNTYIFRNLSLPLLASLVSLSVSTKIFISKSFRISLLYKTRIPSNRMTSAGWTTNPSVSLESKQQKFQKQFGAVIGTRLSLTFNLHQSASVLHYLTIAHNKKIL